MSPSDDAALYLRQEQVADAVLRAAPGILRQARLCGGTALSRFYLHHRLSYDLDLFLPEFSPTELSTALKQAKVPFKVAGMVESSKEAAQLHVFVGRGEDKLKVSFVEDAYRTVFPAVRQTLGPVKVWSEAVEGLYHRKLRTIVGHAAEGDEPQGGRQTARDLFDLWVLSQVHSRLLTFVGTLAYEFPVEALKNGIADMPWFNLIDELKEIQADDKWKRGLDVEVVRSHLFDQLGGSALGSPDGDEP